MTDSLHDPRDAWHHALRMAAASEQYIAQLRAVLGVSSNEMNALLLLHVGGACSLTTLSERIRLPRPTLSVLVDRLIGRGWVSSTPDLRDRRRIVVDTTDAFAAQLEEWSHPWRQRLQNQASAHPAWPDVVDQIDQLCDAAVTSARELLTFPQDVRRPAR